MPGIGQVDRSHPDITSRVASCSGFSGTFGTVTRPMIFKIRDALEFNTRIIFKPVMRPPTPPEIGNRSRLTFNSGAVLAVVSGAQVPQRESRSEVDPAIFTDDQWYEDVEAE